MVNWKNISGKEKALDFTLEPFQFSGPAWPMANLPAPGLSGFIPALDNPPTDIAAHTIDIRQAPLDPGSSLEIIRQVLPRAHKREGS
jgi:hypothetical protein